MLKIGGDLFLSGCNNASVFQEELQGSFDWLVGLVSILGELVDKS
jgi:hypothetical protein